MKINIDHLKLKAKSLKLKKGFTLIELLVAVAVLGIIILGANNLFFYTLKGGKKTDILAKIKQNGSYALSSMSTRIRNAASIVNCQPTSDTLEIKNYNGESITYDINASGQIASNSTALTSNDLVASGLSFACNAPAGKPPTISIFFNLTKTGATEESASETFQSTISLRNY